MEEDGDCVRGISKLGAPVGDFPRFAKNLGKEDWPLAGGQALVEWERMGAGRVRSGPFSRADQQDAENTSDQHLY